MDIEELPLQELFTRLRKAGLSLGIEEYKLLLKAIRGGLGFPDRAALARLCCTLWVKSPQEKRIFDYHFEQLIGKPDSEHVTATLPVSVEADVAKSGNNRDKNKSHKTARKLAWGGILLLSAGIVMVKLCRGDAKC